MVHESDFVDVKKSGNKLTLTLLKGKSIPNDWWNDDGFFWNDLYLHVSALDGWSFIIDTNRNLVFSIDDYHWSAIKELRDKGKVTLTALDKDDAEDYLKEFGGE